MGNEKSREEEEGRKGTVRGKHYYAYVRMYV